MSSKPPAPVRIPAGPTAARPTEAAPVKPKWTREDALRSAKERGEKVKTPGFNPYEDIVADWTDEEIRSALEASLKHPQCALQAGAAAELPSFLLGVWMKRDLEASLAWVHSQEESSMKHKITQSLAYQWPLEKAAEGVDYLLAHRDFFPGASGSLILRKAIQQSAMKGVEDVKTLIRKIDGGGLELINLGNDLVVPDGFDFPALMNSPELEKIQVKAPGTGFAMEWFQQDRAAAFDWMLEHRGMKEIFVLAYGNGDMKGDIQWMGGRVEAMEPAQQEEFFEAVKQAWLTTPSHAKDFAEGVKDPAFQEEIRLSFGVRGIAAGRASESIGLLEAVADPAKRIAALEQTALDDPSVEGSRRLAPKADDSAFLRKKLAEWQATPEQIETIMKRLQP